METLYGFLADISKDLVCGTVNQLRYSFCFNGFVKELEKEQDKVTATIRSVEDRVTHARRQTLKTAEVIDKWLQNANSDAEDVNRLLKEANAKKSCCFGYCPNWIWRYRLGKKLANKKTDLQNLIQEGKQYILLERTASIPSGTLDILTEKITIFESRKFVSDKLMEAVKDDSVVMIGLWGMGGCGKTTLAMEVKQIAEAEHLFDKVTFVSVSSTVQVPRIQEKIASSMQYSFPEIEEMERAQRLCMRLTQEKNILMILDDVWEKLDFGRIGIPSSEHRKGWKILITTRSEEVCTLMDCERKIYLPILTDEEAWTLFQNKALISEYTPETIKCLAISISKECKGLPIAIAAVAGSLKCKEEAIWNNALNRLRSSKPINIGKGLRDPYKCLQLSYDNLDTEEAKSLFLLCSVFPEDRDIPVECLIRCAIGLGLAGEVNSYEEARSEVIAAKVKLVSSCLMLDAYDEDANDECVQMHDLVRDVAQWIGKNENKIIKCEPEKDVSSEQSAIRYLWCVKFPDEMDSSNLEFLCIETKLEVSDGIFERMGKLRVLIFFNKSMQALQLPTMSSKKLTNLRCLALGNWKVSDISFVRDMKKLQSLSLHGCSLSSFLELQTEVAVTQLKNLKLLEFNKCLIGRKNFEEIKRITSLEELYIIEGEFRTAVEFFNSFSVPQTLKRYAIIFGCDYLDYKLQTFCSHHGTLLLPYFPESSTEAIRDLGKKAKELFFVANVKGGAKNIMPDILEIEGGMNELNDLVISDSEEINYFVDTSNHLSKVGNMFSKLYRLAIRDMDHLRALWHGPLPANGSFEKLEQLVLIDCPELTSLFAYAIFRGLVHLKILQINNCDRLKHIVADDDTTRKSEDELWIGHSKIFQNLKEVEVTNCGELRHVFSGGIIGGLPQLKMLEIGYCNKLEQIIGDVVPSAHHDKNEAADEIVEEDEHQQFESSQFKSSPKTTSIPSPPIFNNSSGSFTLSSLAILGIYSCPMLDSLFTASVAKTLTSLEDLTVRDCDGLKHIVTHSRVKRNQKESMVEDDHEFQSYLSMFPSLRNYILIDVTHCNIYLQCLLWEAW